MDSDVCISESTNRGLEGMPLCVASGAAYRHFAPLAPQSQPRGSRGQMQVCLEGMTDSFELFYR